MWGLLLLLCPLLASSEDPFRQLQRWTAEAGATSPPLTLRHGGEGPRAVVLGVGVRNGEVMFRVPTRLCITLSAAKHRFPTIEPLLSFTELEQDREVLTLTALVLLLRESEPWRPYLAMLPEELNLPVNYTVEELRDLKGSSTLLQLVRRQWLQLKSFQKVLKDLGTQKEDLREAFGELRLEELIWGYSVVQSRAFRFYKEGDEMEMALVPLIDMMNHRSSPGGAEIRMSIHEDEVVVTASGDFEEGSLLEGRYVGEAASMGSWMASYGFVDRQSLFQAMRIDPGHLWRRAGFDLSHQGVLQELLESRGCTNLSRHGQAYSLSSSGFSQSYLECMRFALTSPEEMPTRSHQCPSQNRQLAKVNGTGECQEEATGLPFSVRNEHAVVMALLGHLHRLISEYPTTLKQDAEMLSRGGLSARMQAIVELRQREKALYYHGIQALKQQWMLLIEDP
eukprot:TRINITY_DN59845_c0_g1_i1.p1 TRINITY_DN59845_c0_g1~~TRINITY_DN59845_c0_g1_i1.p1  ORF type:complete len:452 (+),score=89.38 TRINITY_DN59845_c0_g1_i1:227-1582(+)